MNGPSRAGLVCVLVAWTVGCGDNSKECGEGTSVENGFCVPGDAPPPTCTGGTILDERSNTCVIDEATCQDGTVLINNACKDPTAGLTVDVIEGPEPNGFGLGGEHSTIPAGLVTLNPAGAPGVIVKGNITPRADADGDGQPEPDFDTYVIDVDAPAMLEITADGVHGLAGGFFAVGDAAGLEDWTRTGINVTGDTARRQLYLPTAGRYLLAIADTRSLVLGAAVGDAGTDYYVTIARLAIPTAAQLTAIGGEIHATGMLDPAITQLFAVPLGAGTSEITLTTEHAGLTGGLVLAVDDLVVATATETKLSSGHTPAVLVADGVDPTALSIVIVDPVIATATAPVAFMLDVVPGGALRSSRRPARP